MGLTDRPCPTPVPQEFSFTSLRDPLLQHVTLAHPPTTSRGSLPLGAGRTRPPTC